MNKKSTREKVRSYRERMRAMGLRQIQVWIPDTRSEAFSAEAHRQSLAVGPTAHGVATIRPSSTQRRTRKTNETQ
jgi:hypothetical protein